MGSQYLNLGLFIVLLSFFIVLNSMSVFEKKKTQAAFESLSRAFLTQFEQNEQGSPSEESALGDSTRDGDSLEKLLGSFRSAIPDIQSKENRFGNALIMEMSVEEFEAGLLSGSDRSQRLDYVIAGFLLLNEEIQHEVVLNLYVPNSGVASAADDGNVSEDAYEAMARIERYASVLQKVGVEPKFMTVGLLPGKSGLLSLVFRRHMPMEFNVEFVGGGADAQ